MFRSLNPMPAGPSLGVWTAVIGLHGVLLGLLLVMAPARETHRIAPTVWTHFAELPEAPPLERAAKVPQAPAVKPMAPRAVGPAAVPERQSAARPAMAAPSPVPPQAPTLANDSTPRAHIPEPARPPANTPSPPPASSAGSTPPESTATTITPAPSAAANSASAALGSSTVTAAGLTTSTAPTGPAGSGQANGGTASGVSNPSASANRVAATPADIQHPGCKPNQSDYPLVARDAEAEGTTRISLAVDANGKLVDRQILRSAGPSPEHRLLDRVALDKLSRCRFTAGRNELGEPVASRIQLDIVWRLN